MKKRTTALALGAAALASAGIVFVVGARSAPTPMERVVPDRTTPIGESARGRMTAVDESIGPPAREEIERPRPGPKGTAGAGLDEREELALIEEQMRLVREATAARMAEIRRSLDWSRARPLAEAKNAGRYGPDHVRLTQTAPRSREEVHIDLTRWDYPELFDLRDRARALKDEPRYRADLGKTQADIRRIVERQLSARGGGAERD
ncbi:MAG: hypothetical protein AAGB93_23125 [Planctomycetota bacterium]